MVKTAGFMPIDRYIMDPVKKPIWHKKTEAKTMCTYALNKLLNTEVTPVLGAHFLLKFWDGTAFGTDDVVIYEYLRVCVYTAQLNQV